MAKRRSVIQDCFYCSTYIFIVIGDVVGQYHIFTGNHGDVMVRNTMLYIQHVHDNKNK